MAELQLQGLRRTYPNGVTAVDGIDLTVADGEFMVLVGPSGCGKSTTLRMIAGLEEASAGRLLIGGRDVTALAAGPARPCHGVPELRALSAHDRGREHGLRAARRGPAARQGRGRGAARGRGPAARAHLLDRKPRALSGGQRQRVAIGRAIVREPRLFLFDEPLSNLDASLRTQMRLEMARLHERLGATIVYVTHDQVEAMTLGDRIAVFNAGRIEQVGTPAEVYRAPVNRFVAGFLGSPPWMNLPARSGRSCAEPGGAWRCRCWPRAASPLSVRLPGAAFASVRALGVRPEHWQLMPPDMAHGLQARVERVEWLGDVTLVHCRLEGAEAANTDDTAISGGEDHSTCPRPMRWRKARPCGCMPSRAT